MIRITYQTYSKILDKTFTNVKEVKSMSDWDLFNMALFHGHATVVSTEAVK